MLKEFKDFAMRGNVVDMAVGIIIGAAFGKIVESLVRDIIMPPIGLLLGKVDFSNQFVILREGTTMGPYPTVEDPSASPRRARTKLHKCHDTHTEMRTNLHNATTGTLSVGKCHTRS